MELGAVVLCAALARNAAEGHSRRTDVDPQAGYFLRGEHAKYGKVFYGDSLKSLQTLSNIDVFINDSDHSADYELANRDELPLDGEMGLTLPGVGRCIVVAISRATPSLAPRDATGCPRIVAAN